MIRYFLVKIILNVTQDKICRNFNFMRLKKFNFNVHNLESILYLLYFKKKVLLGYR